MITSTKALACLGGLVLASLLHGTGYAQYSPGISTAPSPYPESTWDYSTGVERQQHMIEHRERRTEQYVEKLQDRRAKMQQNQLRQLNQRHASEAQRQINQAEQAVRRMESQQDSMMRRMQPPMPHFPR